MLPEVAKRIEKELASLQRHPPPGATAWAKNGRLDEIELRITGPDKSVYEGGKFNLLVIIPERYPSQPPKVQFTTPIYHPNIDNGGRICLHLLNAPPMGNWDSRLTLSALCLSIGLLMAEPIPDDGLMMDIAKEFKESRELFNQKARDWTQIHAVEHAQTSGSSQQQKRKRSSMSRKRSLSLATIIESDSEQDAAGSATPGKKQGRKIFTAMRRRERRLSEGSRRKFAPLDLSSVVVDTPTTKDKMDVEELEPPRQKRRLV
ncbi:hypothetical protein BSKO_11775 [Bryopsis sp. KO-2023]|nr:hypothetical protein BSKO_11775 [Bryopsis sp. KO-2023]